MYEEINISDEPDKFIDYLLLMTDDRQYNKYLIDNIYRSLGRKPRRFIFVDECRNKKYITN